MIGVFSPRLVTTMDNLDVLFPDTANHTVIFIYDFCRSFKVPFIHISSLASNTIGLVHSEHAPGSNTRLSLFFFFFGGGGRGGDGGHKSMVFPKYFSQQLQ